MLIPRGPALSKLGFWFLLILGASRLSSQPSPSPEPLAEAEAKARSEERTAGVIALREAMIAGRHSESERLASDLAKPPRPDGRASKEPSSRQIWTQQLIALLTLQPSDPVQAATLARQLEVEIETQIPDIPEPERSRVWLLLAQLREQLLGDPIRATAAYQQAVLEVTTKAAAEAKIKQLAPHLPKEVRR